MLWSGNFVFARALAGQVSPVTLGFLRWLIACLFLAPFCYRAVRSHWSYVKAHWGYLMITSLSGLGYFALLIYIGANFTSVLNLSLIASSSPIFTLLMARVILKEELTAFRIIGIFLALIGVITLAVQGDIRLLFSLKLQLGDILALTAAVMFAVYNILLRYRPLGADNKAFVAFMLFFSWLGTVPFLPVEWGLGYGRLVVSPSTIMAIGYLSLGASICGVWVWNWAIEEMGPGNAVIFYYFLPLFGGLGAWLLLGEPATWIHVISGGLILAGTILASKQH